MPTRAASALLAALLASLAPLALSVAGAAEPAAKPAPLTVEAIEVKPPNPGPDTLCQLRVRVKNAGPRQASALAFEVRIDGQELAVYRKQLYLQTIAPGATGEVRLFNFWTSETGRPAPADGKLKVEVALKEARWVEVKQEGGAEVWRPAGPVEGLPSSAALTVALRPAGAGKP
jgi:hypothetical protein